MTHRLYLLSLNLVKQDLLVLGSLMGFRALFDGYYKPLLLCWNSTASNSSCVSLVATGRQKEGSYPTGVYTLLLWCWPGEIMA